MKTLALLSGKGGSGKTTLGLTMSSVLSKSGVGVLLVDCDFSTHGATYFFEDRLPEYGNAPSFLEIVRGVDGLNRYLEVDIGFYFIPSIKQVTGVIEEFDSLSSPSVRDRISDFVHDIERSGVETKRHGIVKKIDLIIFDCQAGNSSILPSLLPNVDSTLMVLEPDKVSTSALRSIYTKTSPFLSEKNVFQVFNKVDEKEKEFYEQITFGTFFINVGALQYDWSIRKAFAFSMIPDVENEGLDYGIQICDLCYRIITDNGIRTRVKEYKYKLQVEKKKKELSLVEKSITEFKEKVREFISWISVLSAIASITMFAAAIVCRLIGSMADLSNSDIVFAVMMTGLCTLLIGGPALTYNKDNFFDFYKIDRKELARKEEQLKNEINSLQKEIGNVNDQ